ncbi:MAG: sigma-70 family RNA polymerase sigma factor [Myxococcota bacterium]
MWADDDLLRAWRGGDKAAGDALVRRHYESVRRFFDLRIPAAAEDLTQQAFLACVVGKERVRGDASFKAYLFGVARNLLLRQLRNQQRFERMAEFKSAQGPDTVLTPSGVVALRQEHRLLLRAFEQVPTDGQIALQLHYWEGMSTAEIASVLDLSVTAVTSRLLRARQRLRAEVEAIRVRPEVRASLLADLDKWTRSMVPNAPKS